MPGNGDGRPGEIVQVHYTVIEGKASRLTHQRIAAMSNRPLVYRYVELARTENRCALYCERLGRPHMASDCRMQRNTWMMLAREARADASR